MRCSGASIMSQMHVPLAIVYDFDGTLTPGNVQEPQFIPDIGMKPEMFWAEVDQLASTHQADKILMYMRLMLEKARAANVPVRLEDFHHRGGTINFFEGVPTWFDRINEYGRDEGVRIRHYIVTSGNAELIEGTSIASNFEEVYASRFIFDENGVAVWPAQALNYTTKTQYLFRINKGAHDPSDDTEINQFVEMKNRPMPFENMVYIGDGPTDVPCFRLVKDLGGLSIAVFRPYKKRARAIAEQFRADGRVHTVVPASYKDGTVLDKVVKAFIRNVATRAALGGSYVLTN